MKPIVILDECVERRLIQELAHKYNILVPKYGMTDDEVLDLAMMIDGYILTYDRGFPSYPKLIYAKGYYDAKQKLRKI